MRGTGNDQEFINSILVTLHPSSEPLSCNQRSIAKAITREAINSVFADSLNKFDDDPRDRLFNLVIRVSGDGSLDDNLISANPGSYVVGKFVEDAYIHCTTRARLNDTLLGEE